jgi:hypothetical protein
MNITQQNKWKVSKSRDMRWGEPYIPCKYGLIRQYDDGDLDVWVTTTRMSAKLEKIWKVKKRYDDWASFIRPFTDLDQACRILKARKRRKVTDSMRLAGKRLAERTHGRLGAGSVV